MEDAGGLSTLKPLYKPSELARPSCKWEISRDHLIFSDIFGIDSLKKHAIHVLECTKEGVHDCVLLILAGNCVVLYTLQISDRNEDNPNKSYVNIHSRKVYYGHGGSGVGCIGVHPNKSIFAIGEKGIKPYITIYSYPKLHVTHVLRNGTEYSYSCLCFSNDGEKLASVGAAPDYLLVVWNWKQEQTILRCKAFGQEVFNVHFAPFDNGFLTTSGVGHIRFWKMASTFTGLKLQGDLGKFGKSELSDIEAFSVLPDKKVLSGTESGLLLLWDGNFIKCEIYTVRTNSDGNLERQAPHSGAVTVVNYERDSENSMFITAGNDGCVIFWDFVAIDQADILPDDTVAVVTFNRAFSIKKGLHIRAVLKRSSDSYLVQDASGSIHQLILYPDDHKLIFNYFTNLTGSATGIACSPSEHFAASCGKDGSIRAWDYVNGQCICTTYSGTSMTRAISRNSPNVLDAFESPVAATSITWVPIESSVICVSNQTESNRVSRQVAVGFEDGLVRIFLLDIHKEKWVRTNVFKPHNKQITTMTYSSSGRYFVTASDDSTFFIFNVRNQSVLSESNRHPPEYLPLGFQKTHGAIKSMSWRPDELAILVTIKSGLVLEYQFPTIGLDALVLQRTEGLSIDATNESQSATTMKSTETYELNLKCVEYSGFRRFNTMALKELEAIGKSPATGIPSIDEKVENNFLVEVKATNGPPIHTCAMYKNLKTFYLCSQKPFGGSLYLCDWDKKTAVKTFPAEEIATITSITTSESGNFILCGLSNGKFQIRSASNCHAFLTGELHDGFPPESSFSGPTLQVAMSYDDNYILSAGHVDGILTVCVLHTDKVELSAKQLQLSHDTLLKEASIAGDQAREKQQSHLNQLQKDLEAKRNGDEESHIGSSSANSTDLLVESLPAYHYAVAYGKYIDERLRDPQTSVGWDNELYGGVTRQAQSPGSLAGIPIPTDIIESNAIAPSVYEVEDIKNSREAYTIEDAKRKQELDSKAHVIQLKQQQTKLAIEKIRDEFMHLKSLDESYPPENQLSKEEWEIDVDYGHILKAEGESALEEVRKAMAYAVEEEEILLKKMRDTYITDLAMELITLKAFESGLSVQTFRTIKIPSTLQNQLNEIHEAVGSIAEGERHKNNLSENGCQSSVLEILSKDLKLREDFPLYEEEWRLIQSREALTCDNGSLSSLNRPSSSTITGSNAKAHGFDARKKLRTTRKQKLQHWIDVKPGDNADDPRDVVAIAYATRSTGDFKLKTATDYVVPENQRVNAIKKRRQMALLEEFIYNGKQLFNAKILELRELKKCLVQELQLDMSRIQLLEDALNLEGDQRQKDVYTTDISEWPEQREEVSEADIDYYMQASTLLDRMHNANASVSNFSTCSHAPEPCKVRDMWLDPLCNEALRAYAKQPLAMDAEEADIQAYLMKKELNALILKKKESIHVFDQAIEDLRYEKMKLDVVFRCSELRLFTLLRELSLLYQFESKENILVTKLERIKSEKNQVVKEIADIQELIQMKKSEIEEWSSQEKSIYIDFTTLVNGSSGSQHPNFSALQKIFKKKLKRSKRKGVVNLNGRESSGPGTTKSSGHSGDNDPEDEVEEDEDDEDEDDDEDDDDDDDEEEDEVCPVGCDLQLYEQVLKLREMRADIDEALSDLMKANDDLKKNNDRLHGKLRQIDKELLGSEQDIQSFQSEKQMRFNELAIVLPLSKAQIHCLEWVTTKSPVHWQLPESADDCLVLSLQSFDNLTARIESLKYENKMLRQQFKDLHKQQAELAKEKKHQLSTISDIQKKCHQLQMLKFGQIIDIDLLDKACDATKVYDLQAKVREKEIESDHEALKQRTNEFDLKHQLLLATEENTNLLSQIANLQNRQFTLEKQLNQSNLFQQKTAQEEKQNEEEAMERMKLIQLVKLQAREVEALKQEIGLLRGKDGKIYAPRL